MSALTLVELSLSFEKHGIGAEITAQIASVVRTAGLPKVVDLGSGILTNAGAGEIVLAYLKAALDGSRDSDTVAHDLELVADLQRLAVRSFGEGAAS